MDATSTSSQQGLNSSPTMAGASEVSQLTAGMPAGWVFVENEGALFRGPGRGLPAEVWSPSAQAFKRYTGKREKPVEWGSVISAAAAQRLIDCR